MQGTRYKGKYTREIRREAPHFRSSLRPRLRGGITSSSGNQHAATQTNSDALLGEGTGHIPP